MQENTNYLMLFNYPKNRKEIVIAFGFKLILLIFLAYVYFKQDDTLGQSVFLMAIFAILVTLYFEFKTFYLVDQIAISKSNFVLFKNKHINSKTLFSNLIFKVTPIKIGKSDNIDIDFYTQDTRKHLMKLKRTYIDDDTFDEFIENLVILSNRDKNDFLTPSHNQLISFSLENMDDKEIQAEYVRYTSNTFFSKYNFLLIIYILLISSVVVYFLN